MLLGIGLQSWPLPYARGGQECSASIQVPDCLSRVRRSAQLDQPLLCALWIRSLFWWHPVAQRTSREQQACYSNMIDAVAHSVAPTFARPNQRCRCEHTIESIHRCTVSEKHPHCIFTACHCCPMECGHAVAVFDVWVEAALEHYF